MLAMAACRQSSKGRLENLETPHVKCHAASGGKEHTGNRRVADLVRKAVSGSS